MAKTTTYKSIAGLNRALRSIPKEASVELRDASVVIASDIARKAQAKARSLGGLAAILAPTIRSTRDRVPKVLLGGSARLPLSGNGWERSRSGSRQTVGDVWAGGEFGSMRFSQFSPWRGNKGNAGYFLWPTIRQDEDHIMEEYGKALSKALKGIR